MSLVVVLAVFALATAGLLLSLRALGSTGVPVRSASPEAVAAALELLALKDGERFVDLGAGRGNVLKAGRARADVEAEGFELNPAVALLAALACLGDRRIHVRFGDSRQADLSKAQAIYAYLMPRAMTEWAPKLASLPPGTRIVSVDFELPGWVADETRRVGPLAQPVRLYRVGARGPPAQ